jgi:SAM-dependent methyltransferase
MSTFPESSVHKIVPLKFSGVELRLKTSQALFSARHVDDGTMLLLKTLAQRGAVPETGRVLDAGCGYGPLALALKKFRPALEVTARDRLALAAAYTAENARLNGLAVDAAPGLLLDNVPGPWDLIVSNIPAKAGEPVLADFAARSLTLLSPAGLAAAVVVEPLAVWFADQLGACGAEVVYQEPGPGYRVYHWKRGGVAPADRPPAFPGAYRRGEVRWACGPRTLDQKTFYGLPNFDGLDFRLQVTLPLLETLKPRGGALVWEPVQGHLAAWADAVLPPETPLALAGNDALGLAAASQNVVRRTASTHCVPTLGALDLGPGSLGCAFVQIHSEPEVPWVDDTLDALRRLLAPGALAVVNGGSTDLTRMLERHKGLRKVRDGRNKGWRALILERQTLS